jgi:hypothetical protein
LLSAAENPEKIIFNSSASGIKLKYHKRNFGKKLIFKE